jgi:hypothetical protein
MTCTCAGSGSGGAGAPTPAVDAGTSFANGGAATDFAPPIAADGGTDKARPAEDGGMGDAGASCECHQTQDSVCQPIMTSCSSDSECAPYFQCVIPPVPACDPNPSPNTGVSACQAMAMDAAAVTGTCQPKYKADGVVRGSDGSTSPATAPEASDPGAGGGHAASNPPTDEGSSNAADAGADDDGAAVPVDQPRCSVSRVGAAGAHTSGFVTFGVLMFALRLRRQRKRG